MKYLLDTNICIYLLNGRQPEALRIARRFDVSACALSVITEFELEVGFRKGRRNPEYRALLTHFISPLQVVSFEREDAGVAADIRAALEGAGAMIGPYDLLIAAQALARKLILVTNNEREFKRVPGLKVENWTHHK